MIRLSHPFIYYLLFNGAYYGDYVFAISFPSSSSFFFLRHVIVFRANVFEADTIMPGDDNSILCYNRGCAEKFDPDNNPEGDDNFCVTRFEMSFGLIMRVFFDCSCPTDFVVILCFRYPLCVNVKLLLTLRIGRPPART